MSLRYLECKLISLTSIDLFVFANYTSSYFPANFLADLEDDKSRNARNPFSMISFGRMRSSVFSRSRNYLLKKFTNTSFTPRHPTIMRQLSRKRSLTFLQHRHFTISMTPFYPTRHRVSQWDTLLGEARESSTVGASRLRRRDADEARRRTARRSLRRRR